MEKRAPAEHPIHDLIARRWSPRAFDQKPVPREVLASILEAARWGASSANEQPWRYLVGIKSEDPEQFDRLASVLMPGNAWAREAPVLLLSIAKTHLLDGSPNRTALHDVGLASGNLVIEAMAHDVFTHQMAGFFVDKARELFSLPEGFQPVAMLALGYAGDAETLEEPQRSREKGERVRKRIGEFVFQGNFGEKPF